MRKFRLWCENKKEWEKGEWCILPGGALLDLKKQRFMSHKNHTLEQFIGLKDRNGVEIFEGDRLRWTYKYKDHERTVVGTVELDNCNPCFVLNGDDKHVREYEFIMCGHAIIEIIGNIHEE